MLFSSGVIRPLSPLKTAMGQQKNIADLRSQRWLAGDGMRTFSHRARLAQVGWNRSDFMNRPVIGIINTWSDISTCHSHLRERAQKVQIGRAHV